MATANCAQILVVEDDPSILRGLDMNLTMEGHEVTCVPDGREALDILRSTRFDLLVLDIMLPHQNGYQICRIVRKKDPNVPIILLSAKNREQDIVLGLELGADDYVTKPFRVAELLARVRAHLRRQHPIDRFRFGAIEVDLERRLVHKEGAPVEMSRREFDLLAFLYERQGRAVTREKILARVWGSAYLGTDRTVDNVITRLRHKVDTAGKPTHLLAVRGIGYRFVLGDAD
jgi:DNA-binding response OmpR family regulator